jgi:hypothetical protein
MRRSLTRALAIPVAAVGIIAAGAAIAAPAADAQTTVNIDTSGTVQLTIPLSYVAQLAKAGVIGLPVPLSELSINKANQTATITWKVTGGDADVSVFSGAADLSGSFYYANVKPIRVVHLKSLQADIEDSELVATPKGSSTQVPLLDFSGDINFSFTPSTTNPNATIDTYSSDDVVVDPAGAAYLDSKLDTNAFTAGQTVGTLSATWTVVYPS